MESQNQNQPHISEFFQYQLEQWTWEKVGYACLFAATLSIATLLVTPRANYWQKAMLATGGLLAVRTGQLASMRADGRSRRTRQIRAMENQGFAQWIHDTVVDPNVEKVRGEIKEVFVPRLFNIYHLVDPRNRNRFPHILVLGETGIGKTTLLKRLFYRAQQQHQAKLVYVSPTRESWEMDIPGIRYVGCGSDPRANMDYVGIKNYFAESLETIQRNAKLTSQQKALVGFTECALDETPIIGLKIDWSDWFLTVVSMARKQQFRLWVLATGDQVKTLGIEGRGDMRGNLKYLYMGENVRPRLQELISDKILPKDYIKWYDDRIAEGKQPFIFDKQPGLLPDDLFDDTGTEMRETPETPRAETVDALPLENPFVCTEPLFEDGEVRELPSSTVTVSGATIPPEPSDLTDGERKRRELAITALENGEWMSKILMRWGYGGKKFKQGKELWKRLNLPEKL